MGSAAIALTAGIQNRWLRGLAVLVLMASPVVMIIGFPLMVAAIWVVVR
ncbi:hypothetical protein Sa4125_20980 [Aureimonas sp. SA4125]|nr:hypothetical protein [Aureimonas sp. SA4125]BDA84556.1 hypothetical protein Sa4125_20980 [Aureimonas sp. SA4125]